jgi:molybdate transport system substrate-binding protein
MPANIDIFQLSRGILTSFAMLLTVVLTSISCRTIQSDHLVIAAASNMQYALEEIAEEYESKMGVECDLIIGSSGKLTAQITEGAPYDVFLSADEKYTQSLYNAGKSGAPVVFAEGSLVLWTLDTGIHTVFESLHSDKVRYIALANPELAPFGRATIDLLNELELLDGLEDKLVYGESISQASQFILSQSADIGFTAMSVVSSPSMKGKGEWIQLQCNECEPLYQTAVKLRNGENKNGNASQFLEFLSTESAKQILTKYGYKVVE